jgi:hypothetical protein
MRNLPGSGPVSSPRGRRERPGHLAGGLALCHRRSGPCGAVIPCRASQKRTFSPRRRSRTLPMRRRGARLRIRVPGSEAERGGGGVACRGGGPVARLAGSSALCARSSPRLAGSSALCARSSALCPRSSTLCTGDGARPRLRGLRGWLRAARLGFVAPRRRILGAPPRIVAAPRPILCALRRPRVPRLEAAPLVSGAARPVSASASLGVRSAAGGTFRQLVARPHPALRWIGDLRLRIVELRLRLPIARAAGSNRPRRA